LYEFWVRQRENMTASRHSRASEPTTAMTMTTTRAVLGLEPPELLLPPLLALTLPPLVLLRGGRRAAGPGASGAGRGGAGRQAQRASPGATGARSAAAAHL
jgi:hypothetical protein